MTSLLYIGAVACLLAVAAMGLAAIGSRSWADTTQVLAKRLEAGQCDEGVDLPSAARYHSHQLDGLPAPVQRYFRTVLKEGQAAIAAVDVELSGTFNVSATQKRWKAFTSRQRVNICRRGFLWDANVSVLPGLAVRVYDGYVAGEGRLRAAVLGLFTVADVHGDGEIARGELIRFFAEMAWYPTALLPGHGVTWHAIDDHCANAILVDGPLTVTLLFNFDDAGLIESVRAEARGPMVDGKMLMTPWESRWSDYRTYDGMVVPTTGEAAWLKPEGRQPYFRGAVTSLAYEFSP